MITPVDIESKKFKKVPVGYSTPEVDKFLSEILHDYERLYKENIEFKDKISMLNEGISYYKSMEDTLKRTLILAEKTAEETRSAAYVKSEQIKREAEIRASELMQSSQREINKLNQKIDFLRNQFEISKLKIKQLLVAELEMVLSAKLDYDEELNTNLVVDRNPDENNQDS